jgi:hypothetical protein
MSETVTASVSERTGTEFSYTSQTNTQSLGNVILDTSVVHSIRARDVVFAANGLRPNATLYPFFDSVSVQKYVQQANVLELNPVAATGTVSTITNSTAVTGTSTEFDFELLSNQLVRVKSGVDVFDRYIASVSSNTAATFDSNAALRLNGATLYTLTRVVVADVTPRLSNSGATITYTLKCTRTLMPFLGPG